MKKTGCLILILSVTFTLAGCSALDKSLYETDFESQNVRTEDIISDETSSGINVISVPEKFRKKYSESFQCDMEISANQEYLKEPQAVPNVCVQNVDPDKARSLFFDDTKIEVEDIDRNEEEPYIYLLGENGESFLYSSRTFYFSRPFYQHVMQSFRLEKTEQYNADIYSENQDFPFMDRETAFQTIVQTLENLGVQIESLEYKCYSLDHNVLSEQEFAMSPDGNEDTSQYKDQWSAEDDCYYFVINQKEQGLCLYSPVSEAFLSFEDMNAQIQVLFSGRGIEMLQVVGVMDWDKNFEEVQLADFETILEDLYHKYNMIISDAEYTVKSAELVYMAAEEKKRDFSLKPVWIIKMKTEYTEDGSRQLQENQIIIDAVSGKEII